MCIQFILLDTDNQQLSSALVNANSATLSLTQEQIASLEEVDSTIWQFSATDSAGNTGTLDIKVVIDKTPPGINVLPNTVVVNAATGSLTFNSQTTDVANEREVLLFDANNVESFYEEVIAPFKGELECWFSDNKSIKVYFACIFLTIYSVLIPKNSLIWRVFQDLPVPPESLLKDLNYDK